MNILVLFGPKCTQRMEGTKTANPGDQYSDGNASGQILNIQTFQNKLLNKKNTNSGLVKKQPQNVLK